MSVTLYKRLYDAQMARNRSALVNILAPHVSTRDFTVYACSLFAFNKCVIIIVVQCCKSCKNEIDVTDLRPRARVN